MIDVSGYGKALFELGAENGTDDRIRKELDVVRAALKENPDYVTLLDTPAVSTEEKLKLLNQAFRDVEPMLMNFLSLLCEKRSFYRFAPCADAFDACYDQAHNLLRATAITAVEMTEAQKKALGEKLESITGKTVMLTNTVDPGLIGGITLRYGGVQLDDSIRSRLDKLRSSLSHTIV